MANVVIVGGGIIGCATAYYLAREGATVTVLERGDISGEASGAAAGMLAALSDEGERPRLFTQLCDESLALYQPLLPVLAETGIDVRHHRVGVLNLALRDAEVRNLRARYEKDQTNTLQWLEPDDLRLVEPQANPKALGGLLVPDQQYVDPQRTTQALGEAARRAGARIVEHEPVTGFARSKGNITAVITPSGRYGGDTFVLAGGPWTMALARQLGAYIPTRPIRGQMLSLQGPPTPLQTMIWGRHAYLVPREDGQTYIGATVEDVGYRKQTTAAGIASLRSGAAELVPSLATAKQRRAWAGLRPGSPDEMPIMGRLPGWDNAWVSTGHLRNGILLAPVSGHMLARTIRGEDVLELAALSP
ncbi:MAG TPA: glycine oxidase ThiO, partial [Dehalococcoidia bacterium]|nr:glycine oxidase ThiO [Dehalococcoidia bacterium]